jgi:hypothetical protein
MLGKKTISCFGGSIEGVGKGILVVDVKCLRAGTDAIGEFDVSQVTRIVFLCTIDRNLDVWRARWNIDTDSPLCILCVPSCRMPRTIDDKSDVQAKRSHFDVIKPDITPGGDRIRGTPED